MVAGNKRHVTSRPRAKRPWSAPRRGTAEMPAGGSSRDGAAPARCDCICRGYEGKRDTAAVGLFEDEAFPARWDSLLSPCDAVAWKRPHEICEEPKLFVNSSSRFDVDQGALGTCYFLAACAAVADRPDLLKKVIPEGQVLYGDGYDGSVTFRFWNLGEWQEVRIDDRLPVDGDGDLVYSHCPSSDEYWLPLLEKAFARFYSSDSESPKLEIRDDFLTMKFAMDKGAVIVCAANNPGPGIPDGHAYTVTKVFHVKKVPENPLGLCMVRVRNPWGDGTEWTGAWRDGDARWNLLNKEEREMMEYMIKKDGEFWMEMKDFAEAFPEVAILRGKPAYFEDAKIVAQVSGRWTAEESVGGPPRDVGCFAQNPQFVLQIDAETNAIAAENEEGETKNENVYVDIIQNIETSAFFYIFEVEGPVRTKLSESALLAAQPIATAHATGEECGAGTPASLAPGRAYVVIPCTETAGYPGNFLLRVFGRQRAQLKEIYEHTCCSCPCDDDNNNDKETISNEIGSV